MGMEVNFGNIIPVVIYVIVREGIVPLVARMLPARQQARIKQEAAILDAQKLQAQKQAELERREVAALEQIAAAINEMKQVQVSIDRRLGQLEAGQTAQLSTLQGHTNALAVLVDRIGRGTKASRKAT